MKILLLTISDQKHHPLNKYTDLHRTYDFRIWESGFRAVCPDFYTFDYYASFVSVGPLDMESRIRKLVQKNNIQLLIVPNLYYELAPTFLNELRMLGCKSLVVFFDDSIRFEDTNRFYLGSFDYYLTHESAVSKSYYKPYGIAADFFPCFPSFSFYRESFQRFAKANAKYASDVTFVGAKIADRDVFIDYLKDKNININVYGKGWDAGMVTTEEMLAAYTLSKISLSFVKTNDGSGQVQLKGRLFEIIMAGGFVLSEYCDELTNYFDIGSEIDTFRSPAELFDKVKLYLEKSNLRTEMSARAKVRVEKSYSFESNWLQYLTAIKKGTLKTSYPNPGYKIPAAAINSFLNWNFSLIYGRFMLGQYELAYQQYLFCQRELKGLAFNTAVNKLFFKMVFKRLIKTIARRLLSLKLTCRVRQGYSRCRKLIDFSK